MLQINCPYCGVRDEFEFRFGGEVGIARPSLESTDVEWSDYLFNRSNIKGVQEERWCHSFGCGQWFEMVRDTISHEMISVTKLGVVKTEQINEV